MNYIWEKLRNTDKPIVLYGMGNGADLIIKKLESIGLCPSGVFASDGFIKKKQFHSMDIMPYSEAKKAFGDMIVLLCFGTSRPDVIENIEKIALENELYIPDVPVYGDNFFDREFHNNNNEGIKKIRSILADEISVKTFDNIITYKADAERYHLKACETDEAVTDKEFLKEENGIYLDLGAFNGDTVKKYIDINKSYLKIIAAEPEPKSYMRLCANTMNFRDVFCINCAISQKDGLLPFSKKGGRGSTANGTDTVKARSVDSILDGNKVTLIKMDIEGMESKAIEGACKTIERWKPKLKIAAYHRTEDIFKIPLDVMKIRDDYKIYLRHFPGYPAWDTNYYFI